MLKILALTLSLLTSTAWAASDMANIRQLPPDQSSPKADLSAVSWLAGHWQGEALGGVVEEIWSAPLGGSMMGAFKLVVDGKVRFYEIETISEEDGSLVFRLKHFGPRLTGWEEKDASLVFPLVAIEGNRVYFAGLTLEKVSERQIVIYVATEDNDASPAMAFSYRRVD